MWITNNTSCRIDSSDVFQTPTVGFCNNHLEEWFSTLWNQIYKKKNKKNMGLLPDTKNFGLHMRQECRERFPHNRLKSKPLVSYPSMHHSTYVTAIWQEAATHVPWCMLGCATSNFMYLLRGIWVFKIDWYQITRNDNRARTLQGVFVPNKVLLPSPRHLKLLRHQHPTFELIQIIKSWRIWAMVPVTSDMSHSPTITVTS